MFAGRWLIIPSALLGLLLPVTGFAQTGMDSLLERRVVRCEDVAVNAMDLFAAKVAVNDLDSAELVLDYWEQKCPASETMFRSRILLSLARHTLIDTSLLAQDGLIENLAYYRYLSMFTMEQVTKEAPTIAQFLSFTRAWSTELMKGYSPGMIEHDLAEFYGPDPDRLFQRIQEGAYPATRLKEKYRVAIAPTLELGDFQYSLTAGTWTPTGALARLGIHPEFGFQMGWKQGRINYDGTIAIRTGRSAEPYYAKRPRAADTLESTSHFFGVHFSFDVGYDVMVRGPNEVQVMAGIGYEGFDAFPSNNEDTDQNASAGSLNLSTGIEYRRYLSSWSYLGIQAKYHYLDYTKSKVVDLSGHAITLRLIYGGLTNFMKRQPVNLLQYRLRQ